MTLKVAAQVFADNCSTNLQITLLHARTKMASRSIRRRRQRDIILVPVQDDTTYCAIPVQHQHSLYSTVHITDTVA